MLISEIPDRDYIYLLVSVDEDKRVLEIYSAFSSEDLVRKEVNKLRAFGDKSSFIMKKIILNSLPKKNPACYIPSFP